MEALVGLMHEIMDLRRLQMSFKTNFKTRPSSSSRSMLFKELQNGMFMVLGTHSLKQRLSDLS